MKNKILIADDTEINRIILKETLKDDYDIIECSNGIEVIDFLSNTTELPQMILLDNIMPEMNGIECLKIIKNNRITENIPIIFIPMANNSIDEIMVLKNGAIDFISKPFDPEMLKIKIDNFIKLYNYSKT